MFLFKRKKRKARQKYLMRVAQFDYFSSGKLYIIDNRVARQVTLEPLEEFVFLRADGGTDVLKLSKELIKNRPGVSELEGKRIMQQTIDTLVENKILLENSIPTSLPYYLTIPMSLLNKQKALKLMKQDGYLADPIE